MNTTKVIVVLAFLAAELCGAELSFQNGVNGYTGTHDVSITNQYGGNGVVGRDVSDLCLNSTSGAYTSRVLLRFEDLSIPAGHRVVSASLRLGFQVWVSGFSVTGYYLQNPWQPDAVRLGWLNRSDTARWDAPGGLGPADVLAGKTLLLSGFRAAGVETMTIALDPAIVNQWISNASVNQGLLLSNNVADKTLRMFSSRHSVVSRRPLLTLVTEAVATTAPISLSAEAKSPSQIDLNWVLAAGSSPTGILVERRASGGSYAQIAQLAGSALRYSDVSPAAETQYAYRIRAAYAAGTSDYTSEATVTTPAIFAPPPTVPKTDASVFQVSFRNGANSYAGTQDLAISNQYGGNGVTGRDTRELCSVQPTYEYRPLIRFDNLSFPAAQQLTSATLTLTFDTWTSGFSITGYYLKNPWDPASKGLGWKYRDSMSAWSAPGVLGPSDVIAGKTFLISGFKGIGVQTISVALDPEVVEHWIRDPASNQGILLVNNVPGAVARVYSARYSDINRRPMLTLGGVSVDVVPPTTPTLTAKEASSTEIDLQWTATTDPAATGFVIERKTGSSSYTMLVSLGETEGSYRDKSVVAATTYSYRMLATGASANSAYSAEISVTTPPATSTPPITTFPPSAVLSGAHPRIWLDAGTLTRLTNLKNANDPAWTVFKAKADTLASYAVPAFDRFACGKNQICYTYQGSGWYEAMTHLGLAYRLTGDIRYGSKAKEILNVIIATWQQGTILPISADNGYPSRFIATALALGYDWCHELLSAADKENLSKTLNVWYDWYAAKGYQKDGPAYGNYFGGHILGFGLGAIATKGDNPRSDEIATFIRTRFDSYVVPAFTSGGFAGGYPVESFNYGPNHFGRLFQYMWALKTAGGDDLFARTNITALCARNLLYNIKPGGWRVTDEGDFSGTYAHILPKSYPLLLGNLLGSAVEGQWMQFAFQNLGTAPVGASLYEPSSFEKLLYYDPAKAGTDYRKTLPLSYFSPGDAHTYARSDWTNSAVWSSFNAGGPMLADHQSRAAGHISIQRGNDYLLINAGQWKGSTGLAGNPQIMDSAGWRANTLFFDDGGEYLYQGVAYTGGQAYWGRTQVLAHEETASYSFSRADLSSAYDRRQNQVDVAKRSLRIFHRTFVNVGGATLFVFDRIQVLKPTYTRKLFWHVPPEAVNRIIGNLAQSSLGTSNLWIKTLWPVAPTVSLANDMTVWGGTTPYSNRFEVSDPSGSTNSSFLTVLMPRAASTQTPSAELIDAGTMRGAWQADGTEVRVVLFSVDGMAQSKVLYAAHYANDASATHIILDVADGIYAVKKNGQVVAPSISPSAAGVLTFPCVGGGTFEVGPAQ